MLKKIVIDGGLVLCVGKISLCQLHENIAAGITLRQVARRFHHVFRHATIQEGGDFREHVGTGGEFLSHRLWRETSLVRHRFHGNGPLAFAGRYINSGFQDDHPPGSPIQLVHLVPHQDRD